MSGEKRSHDEMAAVEAEPEDGETKPTTEDLKPDPGTASIGMQLMLPGAALMAMTAGQTADATAAGSNSTAQEEALAALLSQQAATNPTTDGEPHATTTTTTPTSTEKTELAAQQQQLLQQQLQLLQLQQQQLQALSPSDLSALTTMAHQMALGMVMMPMMPLMMNPLATTTSAGSPTDTNATTTTTTADEGTETNHAEHASPELSAEALMAAGGADVSALQLMSAGFGLGLPVDDQAPKRKRGRPAKKDTLRKPDDNKPIKQLPLWAFGMPLPLVPGVVNGVDPTTGLPATSDENANEGGNDDGSGRGTVKAAKKKTRGTGKPRGRPRTRPRPGEIIHRAKPLPIAPASFPGMQEFLVQKMSEWKTAPNAATNGATTTTPATEESESRLGTLGTTMLPGETE